jgi:hypothetical protein
MDCYNYVFLLDILCAMEELEFQVFLFIKSNQNNNGNKCGTSLVEIYLDFSEDLNTIKKILNKLNSENKIKVRQGLNSKLIFIP